jgi:glycosyltransferase involved in cell wall biosynthesis
MELKAADKQSHWTDLTEDYRSLGRRLPERWQGWLLKRAASRPALLNHLIDWTRGPQMRGLSSALGNLTDAIVIHCNLPWGNFSAVRKNDLTMPLWHIDDEFYYWQHWIEAMRRSRFALANTPFTEQSFFPKLGVRAQFVGPPIWQPELPSHASATAFRQSQGIGLEEILVLTVCRKAGEKRYDAIAKAVAALRSEGRPVRMLGIGPDADRLPFDYDGCRWIGKLDGADLQRAYAACDLFALMSESESFGMVVPEAWHHGKPVIVNRLCQPVSSLLDQGVDGLAVAPGTELIEAIRSLSSNGAGRIEMGEAGRRKALKHYVRGAAAERLLAGLSRFPRQ